MIQILIISRKKSWLNILSKKSRNYNILLKNSFGKSWQYFLFKWITIYTNVGKPNILWPNIALDKLHAHTNFIQITSEIGSRQKHKNAVHSSDILSPSDNNCFTFISVALIYFVKQNGRHVLIFCFLDAFAVTLCYFCFFGPALDWPITSPVWFTFCSLCPRRISNFVQDNADKCFG